ncbi:hypothetical protein Back2_00540 [Nocardioides baekrokdamisoli]|uniref:Uncharacterized protein n=2 Tax=Nocardioides baekrokdamisoli TaxID=1804624 RepID=A0A3G9IAJ7_9ACTN|nr:hypothetical protein Back2_00540 [Nocardioides baekrokdamisoli]
MAVEGLLQKLAFRVSLACSLTASVFKPEIRQHLRDVGVLLSRGARREERAEKRAWAAELDNRQNCRRVPAVLNEWDAAAYLGLRPWVLMRLRRAGRGPTYFRADRWTFCRYAVEELDNWKAARAGE